LNGGLKAEKQICLAHVNSISDPCCTLVEWLVFLLRGSTEFNADEAFSTLRAHAARQSILKNGLIAASLAFGS